MADATTHDHRERWDAPDVNALLAHVRAGLSNAEIAERMGRTPAAVRSKRYRLRQKGYHV
jgi:DNA-directed RNA polymerase specialized sigma24 family protein